MKKSIFIALIFALLGQSYAKGFRASGSEPFWGLDLKPVSEHRYHATLSLPALFDTPRDITATVMRRSHSQYANYLGQGSDGYTLSVIARHSPCTDDSKGDTWSHSVMVAWGDGEHFNGCGGNRITENSKRHSPPAIDTPPERAKALNTQGFRLYKKGHYYQALPFFYHAAKADKSYPLGQYNLACTASIVLEQFDCRQNQSLLAMTNPDGIIAALQQAIKRDPKRKKKSQTDPDLALVRKSYLYYRDILGYSPDTDEQLRDMLENISWRQAAGFMAHQGSPMTLHFEKGRHTVISTDNAGRQKSGTYQVKNGMITLVFHSKQYGKQQATGRLLDNDGTFDGVLHFDGAAKARVLPFDDYTFFFPAPCEVY